FGYRQYRDRPGDAPVDNTAVAADQAAAKPAKPAAPAPPRMFGSLAFQPCTLSAPMAGTGVPAQCGTLSVAEDPARPQGRRIALNIGWIPAEDDGGEPPDPVFLLAGGPGQSATGSYPMVAQAFREVLKHRGVVLVDQRGTGGSNPLQCEALIDEMINI